MSSAEANQGRTTMDENTLKGGGFVKLRQKDRWAIRVRLANGDMSNEQFLALAELAREFGDGEVHLSVRQSLEIRGVRLDQFQQIKDALAAIGLGPGVCGPRARNTVACPGALTCKRGLNNTTELADLLSERFYAREGLPHKFKTAVSGCPASCAKPQANDVGFIGAVEPVFDEAEGSCIACGLCASVCPSGAISLDDEGRPVIDLSLCERDGECITSCPTGAIRANKRGWRVFVGGNFGRHPALAYEVGEIVDTPEAVEIAERALESFVRHAQGRERLRTVIDRIGLDEFLKEVL